ncbi:hypothetical protein C8J56DRAFT_1061849 [Mycena floridula]|nr:hypothetical protein C8J56DRAFT_1061849 [Mycena floridula]
MEVSHHASNMNKHAQKRGLLAPITRLKTPQADESEDSEDENPSDDGSQASFRLD